MAKERQGGPLVRGVALRGNGGYTKPKFQSYRVKAAKKGKR